MLNKALISIDKLELLKFTFSKNKPRFLEEQIPESSIELLADGILK